MNYPIQICSLLEGGCSLIKGVTWNIIRAKFLSCSNFKRPDILSEAPLPPTLSRKMSLESAYFLIQGPLTRSPLTLSPHKCVTSSTTFLFKKMFCPPWRCRRILETLNLSQNKGINVLDHLLLRGSSAPEPVMGPGIIKRIPAFQEFTDSTSGSQSKGHFQALKPTNGQVPLQTN